ncbi:MAG: MaoC family dehydratase [Alphaproteobacteria bacterium]|jgi:acyl dehydratase
MRTVGLGIAFDELKAGDKFQTINRTITEADLVNFINATGMVEMIFTDATFSDRHGAIKGARPVPGALVYCFCEGLLVQGTMQMTGLAMLETTMKMVGPTNVNDTIHCEVEVLSVRETSKGGRGIVKTRNQGINQNGDVVLEYEVSRMVAGAAMRDASV